MTIATLPLVSVMGNTQEITPSVSGLVKRMGMGMSIEIALRDDIEGCIDDSHLEDGKVIFGDFVDRGLATRPSPSGLHLLPLPIQIIPQEKNAVRRPRWH